MKTIVILLIAVMAAFAYLAFALINAKRRLQMKIDLIDTAFTYAKFMYNESSRFRHNAKKGNVKTFYSGRMSAAVDLLKHLDNVENVWNNTEE